MRDELDASLGDDVARSLLTISRDFEPRLLRALHDRGHPGLRPSFARFLYLVWDEPRPLSDIADELGISRQAVSHTARLVEQAGYAERRPNPADGRSKLVVVTPKGRAVDDEVGRTAIAACEAHYAALAGAATVRALATGLGRLRDGLGVPRRPVRARASIGMLPLVALQARAELVAAVVADGHDGVKPSHHEVLALIGSAGARATDVARQQGVSRQASSATLQELEGLGFLARRPDPRDLRSVVFTLTLPGLRLVESHRRAVGAVESRFRAVLGEAGFTRFEAAARELALALQLDAHDLDLVAARLRDRLGSAGAGRLAGLLTTARAS